MSAPRASVWLDFAALVIIGALALVALNILPAEDELLSRLTVGALAAIVFVVRGGLGGGRGGGGISAPEAPMRAGLPALLTVAVSELGADVARVLIAGG